MAGVKGRSGGPRKNSGGARPGAGRKPKNGTKKSANKPAARKRAVEERLEAQPHGGALKRSESKSVPVPGGKRDMLDLLQDIALGLIEASDLQVRAATAALPYIHAKKGEGGKKDEKLNAAKAIANKFAPAPPPLTLVRK